MPAGHPVRVAQRHRLATGFGSGQTYWRRLERWQRSRVFDGLHRILLAKLHAASELDWSRACVDGSHVRASKRGSQHRFIAGRPAEKGEQTPPDLRRTRHLWVETFTGLRVDQFGRLLKAVRERGGEGCGWGRPWRVPLAERVLLVAGCYRTNLTMRQLAPLFGVSPATVCRVIQRLGPLLAVSTMRVNALGSSSWTQLRGRGSRVARGAH
ncbi:hypothetical protein GCM10010250_66620 [Streptomyces althioticus]|nr:hypothetical protein GCM10010250_66620 [Streptomyces althioticus]